jgi:hypothetical protein
MKGELKKYKKIQKLFIFVLNFSVIVFMFSSCQSKSVDSMYNDNPRLATVQKDKFIEYQQNFEIVKSEILKYKKELNEQMIIISNYGQIEFAIEAIKGVKSNTKMTDLLMKNKLFLSSVKSLNSISGIKKAGINGEIYFSLEANVNVIYTFENEILFRSRDEAEGKAVNYIAYTIDGNPPSHGIQPGEELHIKEYAPHWFSVVEGEPRY